MCIEHEREGDRDHDCERERERERKRDPESEHERERLGLVGLLQLLFDTGLWRTRQLAERRCGGMGTGDHQAGEAECEKRSQAGIHLVASHAHQ